MYSCLSLCLFLVAALLPQTAAAKEPGTPDVRVGWYEDAYNITGEHGERSGYGYEYQQSVAAYTGWTYEYVSSGWAELLELMKNGEIDLMGGVSYTDERAETYEWEQEHDLHMKHIFVRDFEDAKERVAKHEMDCIISTEATQWVEDGMSAIATTGGSDIYFVISKKRPDIKEQLDNAMRKMEYDKPFYADELYERYLSAVSTTTLSCKEQKWLTRHGAIRVGWLNNDSGFSSADPASGEPVGVINDYIQFAENALANQTLEFELVEFDSQEAQMQAFQNVKEGDYDVILMDIQMPKMNGLEAAAAIRNGSNPLGKTMPIIAMTANAFSEDVQHCIGAGMDAHIPKPLDVEVLEKTLRELFGS